MRVVIFWLARTEVATFVRHSAWAGAVLEIVHFLGLSMLLGLVLLVFAAIDVAAFHLVMRRPVLALEAGGVAPLPARIIGGISLVIWISVLIAGRMEAFFKPLLQ